MNRQDACSTKDEFSCGTGILPVLENGAPVPQKMNFLVEQASCLFLRMVQDVSYI
jgi:hypothetical protein